MWPSNSEELIVALAQRDVDHERGWFGGLQESSNRLGEVDAAVRDEHGHLDLVLDRSGPAVKILIWGDDALEGWGRVADLDVVARVVKAWQEGAHAQTIADSQTCIRAGTESEAIAEQWDFLLRHGFDSLQDLAKVIIQDPVLRQLRPWVSHGSLCLLPGNRPIGPDGRHLAFHWLSHDLWWLNVGGSTETYSALPLDEVVALASRLAHAWNIEP
jgi:hypothetical protein